MAARSRVPMQLGTLFIIVTRRQTHSDVLQQQDCPPPPLPQSGTLDPGPLYNKLLLAYIEVDG